MVRNTILAACALLAGSYALPAPLNITSQDAQVNNTQVADLASTTSDPTCPEGRQLVCIVTLCECILETRNASDLPLLHDNAAPNNATSPHDTNSTSLHDTNSTSLHDTNTTSPHDTNTTTLVRRVGDHPKVHDPPLRYGKAPIPHYEKYHDCLAAANVSAHIGHWCQSMKTGMDRYWDFWLPLNLLNDECHHAGLLRHEVNKCFGWTVVKAWEVQNEMYCQHINTTKEECHDNGTGVHFKMKLIGQKHCVENAVYTATGFDLKKCRQVKFQWVWEHGNHWPEDGMPSRKCKTADCLDGQFGGQPVNKTGGALKMVAGGLLPDWADAPGEEIDLDEEDALNEEDALDQVANGSNADS